MTKIIKAFWEKVRIQKMNKNANLKKNLEYSNINFKIGFRNFMFINLV